MKTIVCSFKSNGEDIKVTAVINDALTELSKSKKNQATEILDEYCLEDGAWGFIFDVSDDLNYEVHFRLDPENGEKTLKPIKAITWEGEGDAQTITDVQLVTVKIK